MEKELTPVARKLRAASTDAEAKLWSRLRARQLDGFKVVRQFPIGRHVADFACRSARLVIELDGGQHAGSTSDRERTQVIEAHGYTVVRFWNNDVMSDIDAVLVSILRELHIAADR